LTRPAAPPVRAVLPFPADRMAKPRRTRRARVEAAPEACATLRPPAVPSAPPEPLSAAEARRANAAGRLCGAAWHRLPVPAIEALAEALDAPDAGDRVDVLLAWRDLGASLDTAALREAADLVRLLRAEPWPAYDLTADAVRDRLREVGRAFLALDYEGQTDVLMYARGRLRRHQERIAASSPASPSVPAAPSDGDAGKALLRRFFSVGPEHRREMEAACARIADAYERRFGVPARPVPRLVSPSPEARP
jgi:hypothetical protein